MSSIMGMAGPLANVDEGALTKVHRARFSLHLRTNHVRRWLLVQFVSVPIEEARGGNVIGGGEALGRRERLQLGLGGLMWDYRMVQHSKTWM